MRTSYKFIGFFDISIGKKNKEDTYKFRTIEYSLCLDINKEENKKNKENKENKININIKKTDFI